MTPEIIQAITWLSFLVVTLWISKMIHIWLNRKVITGNKAKEIVQAVRAEYQRGNDLT